MSIISPQAAKKEAATINYLNIASKNLLLIFTRNPELGKCKTRLAATVGDEAALDIYKFLLQHTATITKNINAAKQVWYSEEIWETDIWENKYFDKRLQQGSDLGVRMAQAFEAGFATGYERIIVIGSDMHDLNQQDIENAFDTLKNNDFVIGPAIDGGYYLLGMTRLEKALFQNKTWGTKTVYKDSLQNLENERIAILEAKNDVDIYEDIETIPAFKPFLKHLKK